MAGVAARAQKSADAPIMNESRPAALTESYNAGAQERKGNPRGVEDWADVDETAKSGYDCVSEARMHAVRVDTRVQ